MIAFVFQSSSQSSPLILDWEFAGLSSRAAPPHRFGLSARGGFNGNPFAANGIIYLALRPNQETKPALAPPIIEPRRIPINTPRVMFNGLFGLTGACPGVALSTIPVIDVDAAVELSDAAG